MWNRRRHEFRGNKGGNRDGGEKRNIKKKGHMLFRELRSHCPPVWCLKNATWKCMEFYFQVLIEKETRNQRNICVAKLLTLFCFISFTFVLIHFWFRPRSHICDHVPLSAFSIINSLNREYMLHVQVLWLKEPVDGFQAVLKGPLHIEPSLIDWSTETNFRAVVLYIVVTFVHSWSKYSEHKTRFLLKSKHLVRWITRTCAEGRDKIWKQCKCRGKRTVLDYLHGSK